MNPRRIHELMRQNFPPVEHASREWAVVPSEQGPNVGAVAALLSEHISSHEVLVEIHRKAGALLSVGDAPEYICSHIGEAEIRVADRQFTGFVVVGVNGVATGWRASANPSLQATASGGA